MAGKLVIELSELAGMSKTEVEDVKAFISTQSDNYTRKYEAFACDHARRCIFIGTSNNKRPLQDESGNRRFLPVHVVGEANLEWLQANVEQLIGEAAVREANGETFRIPRESWDDAAEHQEAARHISPIEEAITEDQGAVCVADGQTWLAVREPAITERGQAVTTMDPAP
jgi:predicted P-loop ATPase